MITQLNLSNFKSHKDTRLDLGNLTVLTGVNGCGKTSVIQALLLLRQSFLKNLSRKLLKSHVYSRKLGRKKIISVKRASPLPLPICPSWKII